ncbi:MAG: acyl carrier protein [Nitrospirae bacterium]|nr:acyl carrier protein [Nitrospirota bacterium]
MTTGQIQQTVKKFILENILFEDNEDVIKNDDSFLQKGIMDSTGVLELVRFIEEEYKISVDDEELIPENLDSVDNLAKFIKGKTG